MKLIHLVFLLVLETISPFAFSQCQNVVDTISTNARNYYQDGFELKYKNESINQYSDFHAKTKYGMWYFFRSNGDVKKFGHFEFGLKQGWWYFFNRDGILVRKNYYKHGQLLCDINVITGKQRENRYKEKDVHEYKLSDSKFW